MREILFRGKTLLGKWIEGDLLNYLGYGKVHIVQHYLGAGGQEVLPETVGQYTGLRDCKRTKEYPEGQKIFEGDIIRYADIYEYEIYLESLEHPEDFTECVFDNMWTFDKVVYCIEHSYPAFDLCSHDFDANGLCELKESMMFHYEVIGNIHDNPELLKGGEG